MRGMFLLLALGMGLLLGGTTAAATETQDATDFDGVYEITYDQVAFNIHLCVNGHCAAIVVPASGNMPTEDEVDDLRDELQAECGANLEAWVCDWLVDPVVELIAAWVVTVSNQLPETAEVVVDPDPFMFLWWSTGLHPGVLETTSEQFDPVTLQPTGATLEDSINATFDNNDGYNNGNFLSIGLGLNYPMTGDNIICLPVAAATILGNIDRDDSMAMQGAFAGDIELVCLISDGNQLALFNLGVAEAATFSGEQQ